MSGQINDMSFHVDQQQLQGVSRMAASAEVWRCRQRYAHFRPTGWRSDPDNPVSWR